MALLEIVGLCAGYGDVAVLRGVNLSIAAGSVTSTAVPPSCGTRAFRIASHSWPDAVSIPAIPTVLPLRFFSFRCFIS